jgi:hypothetical protein
LLNWFYDIFDPIEIREDIKSGSIVPSLLVIGIATILEVSFIAIIVKALFF